MSNLSYQSLHSLPRHDESQAFLPTTRERVFALIDDHARLTSHMSRPSWRMGGGRMQTRLDEGRGERVGSHIQVMGRVFGLVLSVDEEVTQRNPPARKVWETAGSPRLLVIGPYRRGFEATTRRNGCMVHVFLDYALPPHWPERWLGRVLGRYYARWCVQRIVDDAVRAISQA
jgi:hypothetical protein